MPALRCSRRPAASPSSAACWPWPGWRSPAAPRWPRPPRAIRASPPSPTRSARSPWRAASFSAALPSPASATAQIVTAAAGGGIDWFLVDQHPSTPPPQHGTQVIAPQPGTDAPSSALAASGIPITALQAYRQAAAREAKRRPSCGLTWPLLGGIGRVESNHGRFAGAILHSDGLSTPPVIGIPLNGNGTALIMDTDHGRLDGDTVYDRAVGPMQFIPSTWAGWGVDANHDGVADPFNLFDAAAAAADYLCAAGRNLRTYAGEVQAVRSYNNSDAYISLVLGVERVYAGGVGITVPIVPTNPDPGTTKPPKHHPHLPPVDPGHPPGLEHDPHNPCAPSGSAEDHSAVAVPVPHVRPDRAAGPAPAEAVPDPFRQLHPADRRWASTPAVPAPSSGPSSSTPPPSSSSPPPTVPGPVLERSGRPDRFRQQCERAEQRRVRRPGRLRRRDERGRDDREFGRLEAAA